MAVKAQDSITVSHQKDIVAVFWFYLLQSSTSAAPSKPTAAQATAFINNGTLPGNWKLVEPSYTEGSTNSLYTVQLTKFSDDTGEWSEVSLSSSYEAAKVAYNKSVRALEAVTPIATKTYTGLIGSANDAANASFYFAKVHPTNYTVQWKVSMRIQVTAPESYMQSVLIQFGGYGSTFSSYDAYVVRNSALGMYFVNLYRATSVGISTNHKGHAVGIGLRASTNPINSSYARTVKVELLEVENCTVDMLDTAVKYASMDGAGSTNYAGLTEMYVATAGQNATNNTNTNYTQYGNAVKAGTFGVKRYTLLMKDTPETWVSFVNEANNIGTSKTVSTGGHILGKLIYSAGGVEYASGANTSTVYDAYPIDFRYSANITTSSLVAYKPVYLVGTLGADGLFYLDTTTWWTQTVPTTEDGKTYVLVGDAYSGYQVWLSTENPAYQFYNGKFMPLEEVLADKASKTATKYITDLTDGIFVAPEGQGPNDTQTPTGWKIKDALELLQTGVSYIWAGITNGVAGVRIGKQDEGNVFLSGSGYVDVRKSSTVLAHFGYDEGISEDGTIQVAPYYNLGIRKANTTIGNYSTAEGYNTEAANFCSHAEGHATQASGSSSHAEGSLSKATGVSSHAEGGSTAEGTDSHAEGSLSKASGNSAHAEGSLTNAEGENSHAEGAQTKASGQRSHAEGYGCQALGDNSHAEGHDCFAYGENSHASGYGCSAKSDNQTVIGKYNVADDTNTYAFIIGSGTGLFNRHNALTVDWNGNVIASGDYTGWRLFLNNKDSDYPQIFMKDSNVDLSKADNNISATKYGPAIVMQDTAGRTIHRLETNVRPDGRVDGYWYLRQYDTSGNQIAQKGIRITLDKNGNMGYGISDPTNLRNAILTVSKVTTIADIIAVNSTNATISQAEFVQYGKIVQLYIVWTNKAAISVPSYGNIENVKVGTLVSGKRPSMISAMHSVGDNAGAAWYYAGTDGILYLTACEATGAARTIAAGSKFHICATYILP